MTTDTDTFNQSGYLTIELGHIRQALQRIYLAVFFLSQPYWKKWFSLQLKRINAQRVEKKIEHSDLNESTVIAYKIAANLPLSVLDILDTRLGVKRFGETAAFDHLDFAHWMNEAPGNLGGDWESEIYNEFSALKSNTKEQAWAMGIWLEDLTTLAQLLVAVKKEFIKLSQHEEVVIEHAHLKSWQNRGYKAQWWHIDRGLVSAIATVAGPCTTEFLLQDPATYPTLPPGFDAFVFPEKLDQPTFRAKQGELIICGGRQRKEQGQSYLWHRAPPAKAERLVLIIKTHRHPLPDDNTVYIETE